MKGAEYAFVVMGLRSLTPLSLSSLLPHIISALYFLCHPFEIFHLLAAQVMPLY